MAGRGTDIKIDDEVKALGGLAVFGSERHESRRIDNQLRGRSGRQGDPGFSRFFVSFEDDLMLRHGSERFEGVYSKLGDVAIENKVITKQIGAAQRRVEGVNFDVRKQLLDYDDVLRQQREIIYEQRNYILENEDVHEVVREMFSRVVSNQIGAHRDIESRNQKINREEAIEALKLTKILDANVDVSAFDNLSDEDFEAKILEDAWNLYENKIADVKEQFARVEKDVVLQMMDRSWVDHIDAMSKLREGIHLRSYAQEKPLQAYVEEGFGMFEEMLGNIASDIVDFFVKVNIEYRQG